MVNFWLVPPRTIYPISTVHPMKQIDVTSRIAQAIYRLKMTLPPEIECVALFYDV